MKDYHWYVIKSLWLMTIVGLATYWTKSPWCLWGLAFLSSYKSDEETDDQNNEGNQ